MKGISEDNLKNKKILITGGCGFIGSHLIKRLLKKAARISIFDRTSLHAWRIKRELDSIEMFTGDIADAAAVDRCIKTVKPDYVFHLAAYGVDSAQKEYRTAVNVNVLGIVNLLDSVRNTGCEKFINVGSCAEYGDKTEAMLETMCPCPVSIYGSTKACATILAHQIAKENDISIVTIRPFGIFGEAEEPHKVFTYIILSILEGKEVNLTLCEQHRDYCYVENIIDGLLLAAQNRTLENNIFNIGSGETYPLKYYVDYIFKIIGTNQKPNYGAVPYRKSEMWVPVPDISKIQALLKWEPQVSFEEGIKSTIDWYRNNKNLYL